VQLLRQLPASQVDGLHEMATPCTQVPSPSHKLAGTNSSRPVQVDWRQTVPMAYLAQPPWPLQTPLWPQVSGGSRRQTRWMSSPPAGTAEHSPGRSGRLQATQAPVQETLQQTPSAQALLAHSVSRSQSAPSGR